MPSPRRLAAALALAALAPGCVGARNVADPTVVIQTEGGVELGVSTEYGVVFLGRTARSGYIEITAFYGDGPSIESSVAIEPVGGGLYTVEPEIRLPTVPMTFIDPRPGDAVIVAGRSPSGKWEREVRVLRDERVFGILLEIPPELRERPDQVGAGVYWVPPYKEPRQKRLLGLVSGRLELDTQDGTREFLTVVGPQDLWRLVTHRRDRLRRKPWVYREDIL